MKKSIINFLITSLLMIGFCYNINAQDDKKKDKGKGK